MDLGTGFRILIMVNTYHFSGLGVRDIKTSENSRYSGPKIFSDFIYKHNKKAVLQ